VAEIGLFFFIDATFPAKSGMSDSTSVVGHRIFMVSIVFATCSTPPSSISSLQTEVITT
jgi:hypothetical protein